MGKVQFACIAQKEDGRSKMTYCVAIMTKDGLVLASDSRTNAGYDQVNTCRKMHLFVKPGERAFVILTSGNLSLSQSVLTLLRKDFDHGRGLSAAPTLYDAARVVGEQIRAVAALDRPAFERDDYRFNVHCILGGQVIGEEHGLYLLYPQGNPLRATQDSPFLQTGETKYGRPILDRGIRFNESTLDEAIKYALLSLDSTIRSNVTVGPPIDIAVYDKDSFNITRRRRLDENDPELLAMHAKWERALRTAVLEMPSVTIAAAEPYPY
jgi:putative proteasome-type protease